jgi:hypothetical protein
MSVYASLKGEPSRGFSGTELRSCKAELCNFVTPYLALMLGSDRQPAQEAHRERDRREEDHIHSPSDDTGD